MGTIACTCGHVISDSTDALPYKGYVLRDRDESALDNIASRVQELLRLVESGTKETWEASLRGPISVEDWLSDAIGSILLRTSDILECETCGALIVETGADSGVFETYTRQSGGYASVLDTRRLERP